MRKNLTFLVCSLFVTSFFMMAAEQITAKSRGGSSGGFKSSSSSSRSSYSSSSSSSRSSYSSPSRSSYSSGRSSYSSPSRSTYSSPSRSTYDNRYSSSPSGNYSNQYSTPYQSSPGYSGGGTTIIPMYGGAHAATSSSGGSGAFVFIVLLIIAGVIIYVVIKNKKKKGSGEIEGDTTESHLFFIQAGLFYGKGEVEESLIQTAKAVDTNDISGLLTLLREASMLIRRNQDKIRWYNFKETTHKNEASVEAAFEKLVSDERMKLDTEEFTDQNGMEVDRRAGGAKLEEVIIINMAVACHCDILLDDGITFENFNKLISFFSAIPESNLLGTNIVWNITDQDDLMEKFPELRNV